MGDSRGCILAEVCPGCYTDFRFPLTLRFQAQEQRGHGLLATDRGSRRKIPELEVTQDLFDDLRVFDEADDSQPAATLGAGERIGSPDSADQSGPGAFRVVAEVVRFRCRLRQTPSNIESRPPPLEPKDKAADSSCNNRSQSPTT